MQLSTDLLLMLIRQVTESAQTDVTELKPIIQAKLSSTDQKYFKAKHVRSIDNLLDNVDRLLFIISELEKEVIKQ